MPEYFQICPNNFYPGEGGGCPPSPTPMVPKPITILKRADLFVLQFAVLFVYLPSCLDQETAKWPFWSSSQAANYSTLKKLIFAKDK